jgi:hypothetical protein
MSQAPANPPPAKKAAGGRKLELPEELKVYKGVWVIVEQERGKVHTVSYELLGEARKLADKLSSILCFYSFDFIGVFKKVRSCVPHSVPHKRAVWNGSGRTVADKS